MVKGDIILIPFPFTDLSGNKNRPALVLIEGELDITVAFISTQLKWRENTDILIKPSGENGLKKDSIIRLSKIATIDKELAIGRLGKLDYNSLNIVNHNLKILLKLE